MTAITPTPLGEGKTVTSIGLTEAMAKIGKNVVLALREPCLGPVFGIKGGAAGGGYSQVVPMEDLNLHFTGDIHAVGVANNLLAAMIDTSILLGNPLNIDPLTISWRRVLDISDRALRDIVVGLGGRENGYPRQTGFDITVASEVMAILALAKDLKDLRERFGRIVVAYTYDGKPVTAEDLKAAGAMTVLLKDAIKPNLIQTLEGNPCVMHAGPFANIAHGNNSIVADLIALKCGDYVVTESGFGADMGAEKMMDIKCRYSGITPDCVVITCTVRALKMHGGAFEAKPGKKLDEDTGDEGEHAGPGRGLRNLVKQIENMKLFGVPVVVTVNRRVTDTDAEIALVKKLAEAAGVEACVPIDVWAKGGEGGKEAAEAIVEACDQPKNFKFLYEDEAPSRRRSKPSPPRSTAPTAWTTPRWPSRRSSSSPKPATTSSPSAWPRPTSPSPTTRTSRECPRASACPSGTSAPPSAPASSIRSAARCAPCPACPRSRPRWTWTSTRTEGPWASSKRGPIHNWR